MTELAFPVKITFQVKDKTEIIRDIPRLWDMELHITYSTEHSGMLCMTTFLTEAEKTFLKIKFDKLCLE